MNLQQAFLSASLLAASCALSAFVLPTQAEACEVDRDIVFADFDWSSAQFHNRVAQFILEAGYGCSTDAIPGTSYPLVNGLARGDIDIAMELWVPNIQDLWDDITAKDHARSVGLAFPDAVQGWFVPRYLVEGDDAPAPGLTSVMDLPRYAHLFDDPEDPGVGRFYNCVVGWGCEDANTRKLAAYGLNDHYSNFRPGSGGALAAAIESAVLREQPIVFYYWHPTWLWGRFGGDFVQLDEPAYDETIWETMMATEPADATVEATAYPTIPIEIAANTAFMQEAPSIIAFLGAYGMASDDVSRALLFMQDNDVDADEAAKEFLRTREDLWTGWVSDEVADRVRDAL